MMVGVGAFCQDVARCFAFRLCFVCFLNMCVMYRGGAQYHSPQRKGVFFMFRMDFFEAKNSRPIDAHRPIRLLPLQ